MPAEKKWYHINQAEADRLEYSRALREQGVPIKERMEKIRAFQLSQHRKIEPQQAKPQPTERTKKESNAGKIVAGIVGLIIIFAIIGAIGGSGSNNQNTSTSNNATALLSDQDAIKQSVADELSGNNNLAAANSEVRMSYRKRMAASGYSFLIMPMIISIKT